MVWSLIAVLLLGAAILMCCVTYSIIKLKNDPLERYVRRALICASGTMACYAVGIMALSETVSLFAFSFYNIFETLTAVTLLSFVRRYLGNPNGIGFMRVPVLIGTALDAILMLVNPFTEIAFSLKALESPFGGFFYRTVENIRVYGFHSVFVTVIVLCILGMLLHRMITAPGAYMIKYGSAFFGLFVIAVAGTAYMHFHFTFDYSVVLYVVTGFFMFYFSLIYVPRGLMQRLMFFTVSNMQDGIICIDIDGKVVHANPPAREFCKADDEIRTLENQVKKWIREKLSADSSVYSWESKRNMNGEKHYFSVEYRKIFDSSVKAIGSFFLIHDRTEEYTRYRAERYRATHDKLTGLYNREYFYELVRNLLDENPRESYNIIVTDVKNFKIVNDVFGVEAGDRLLKKISEITESFGGKYCVYARLSGDRFAVCIPRKRFSEEKLLRAYSVVDSFFEDSNFKVHIHMGVYEIADRRLRVAVMCDRASLALKTIKDSYRSHVAYYDNELREVFISEHRVISDFEKALSRGQFQLYIQPQINVNGSIRGGEGLVRWIHPKDGMIQPDKFIHILEQTGLISRLDKYMWELACQELSRWTAAGSKKHYISVNISPKDFYLLDVYEVITGLVEKYGISPSMLHLEITETAIMDNLESQLALIQRLRKYGFLVEIDDFGSGYSSLNMLKEIDADVLKLDMAFLRQTENTEKSHLIVKMIITLAKLLNMEVITEGVETKEQVKFLAEYGCDVYQGYYFAKPMPVEQFEAGFLNKRFRMK
ncbi:MAG: EAL domain-containing protein [Alistipes sp.]|nr:EAL domain-containing protein [Alistipes sp.]